MMRSAWRVFSKELLDALRDRRTLLMVVLSSVAIGPLLLVVLSFLVADIEARAEAREVHALGLDQAPTLGNYLLRQGHVLRRAPADYEAALQDRSFGHAVLLVPADFEQGLLDGIAPTLTVVGASGNNRADSGSLLRLLQGFNQEQAALRLALRGVAPASLQAVLIEQQDLANPRQRAAQLTRMLPFFVLMAMLYGCLHGALDATAGERERGSLEPLLMTPVPRAAIVLGKWAAVAGVGMLIAVLACFGFLPGQWLLRSATLAAMFQFGPAEALQFLALLLPLAGLLAALLMAVAIHSKSFKEAQASATLVVLAVSMLPLITLFNQGGEQAWHLWVPALAQITLMQRVLEGQTPAWPTLLLVLAVAAVLTWVCLAQVVRQLRSAALR